jgi:hypothetical protein
MQAIVSLDKVLSTIQQHECMRTGNKGIMWKSIRAMYACNEDFQQSLDRYFNALDPDTGDGARETLSWCAAFSSKIVQTNAQRRITIFSQKR